MFLKENSYWLSIGFWTLFFSWSLQQVKEDVKRIDIGKEAAIEAEVKAARERAIVPLEIRMKQFRDLLAEKGVKLL